jgi:PmbA protein
LELVNAAEMAVKICERLGADEAEAFTRNQHVVEVVLERGEIQSERSKTQRGIGVRLIKDKKLGFTYSSVLNKDVIEKICRNALKLAKMSPSNPDWVSLPLPKKIPTTPKGIYDEKVVNLNSEDVLDLVVQGYDAVKAVDSRASIDEGKFSSYVVKVAIANSHEISLEGSGTALTFYLLCIAKENEELSSFSYEYDISRTLKGFNTAKVGKLAAQKAVDSLHAKVVESFEGDLLLSPEVAAEILFDPVASSVNADNVQRGRSVWADKIGDKVSNRELTVVDEGLLPYGVGSSPFDAEGNPCQRTQLIKKGILKSFLYDSYTANKAKVESTGNASRTGYSGIPMVSISNIIVEAGSGKFDNLVSEVDRGIVVNRFSGNIDPQSGDFSGLAKQASFIENGEIEFPLKETMISGNTFEVLKNIVKIGRETRATTLSVYTPPIIVKNVKIVSK